MGQFSGIAVRASLLSAVAAAPLVLASTALAAPTGLSNRTAASPLLPHPPLVAAQAANSEAVAQDPTLKANDPAGLESDEDADDDGEDKDQIVVTGTLIRGTAPTGTNPITVGEAQVEASGASRASEVLATLPQVTGNFFNAIPQTEAINATSAGGFNQTTNRPALRPNPFGGTDTGNSTLILFDGARQAGIGVNGSSANPDGVPPALLQRVEVNPDGGSATYGSDAIGGVINFITKKRYDGVLVGGAVGFADNYTTWEANAVAGKDWGTGGAYIGYSFSKNDILLNRERDFYRPLDFSTGLARNFNCNIPNVQVGTGASAIYFPVSGATINGTSFVTTRPASGQAITPNVCTLGEVATLASANEQHSVLARISQDLSEDIAVSLRLRFNDQKQSGLVAPREYSALVTAANPFFRPIPGRPDITSYTVLGNFEAAFGPDKRIFQNGSQSWGALADISWNIGQWRFYGFVNYDRSKSTYSNPGFIATAQTQALQNAGGTTSCSVQLTAAACLNPFNIAASNPALLTSISNALNIGEGTDEIINLRGVFDGPLFDLPGGPVRVAIGGEFLKDNFAKGVYSGPPPSGLTKLAVSQSNVSVFGEINIPLFSEENAIPLIRELRLSAAGRYDHYSTVGGTFNPKLGASWKPFDFLTIRGNWSKTFRAPTTVDLIGTFKANSIASQFAACVFGCFAADPTRPLPGANDVFYGLQGTFPGITPQKGTNWSIGGDFAYNQIQASITYYRIDYLDLLANPFNGTPVFPNLAFLVEPCPGTPGNYQCTQDQVNRFLSQAAINNTSANLNNIYGLYDIRTRNLGTSKVGGLDYSIQFNQPTSWGSWFLSAAGSIMLRNESQVFPFLPPTDNLALGGPNTGGFNFGRSLHRMTIRGGINYGNFRAQVTMNRNAGYEVVRSATFLQDKIDAYSTFNLFMAYEFEEPGALQDGLLVTLNVNNLFNADPPIELRTNSGNGYINGSTLGRLVKIGLEKKFK